MSTTFAEPTWGEVDPTALRRILVVSPHFDDAAMGAGHLLASYDDTTVVTVLGGRPPAYPDVPSEWDALGGFLAGDDVVAARREEDAAAMAVLESGYEWLEFSDHQYLAPPDRPTPSDVAPVLAVTIDEFDPTAVFFPMGLGNPDHVMVHDACLLVRQEQLEREWFCYEDHPGPRPPSSRTCPTRSASDAPSGATRRRSRHSNRTTRSAPAWRGASPSSSGTWPRRPRGGKGCPTSSDRGRATARPRGVGRAVAEPCWSCPFRRIAGALGNRSN
jgi:LmbE family N-acetylglucosaminyl deacetylase